MDSVKHEEFHFSRYLNALTEVTCLGFSSSRTLKSIQAFLPNSYYHLKKLLISKSQACFR